MPGTQNSTFATTSSSTSNAVSSNMNAAAQVSLADGHTERPPNGTSPGVAGCSSADPMDLDVTAALTESSNHEKLIHTDFYNDFGDLFDHVKY
ncbi:unnamed protein product [Anisakis simplex]|uniref:Uncharacterized protein n=1 Tax=Anisakis simplex TaxID=6269 RepID=A0A0M3KJ82_ANISI|nr:unnamed protein product [Anisakis simplex]